MSEAAGGGSSVIVMAGRRIDAADAREVRFPPSRIVDVTIEIHSMLRRLRREVVVTSAACGADLIALNVARSLGMRRRIVLPFAPEEFRATSVVDRPGDWRDIYDDMIASAVKAGDLVIANQTLDRADAFTMANRRLIEEAFALSGQPTSGRIQKTRLSAAVVWEGQSRGPGDFTADFIELVKARGLTVEEIKTLRGYS